MANRKEISYQLDLFIEQELNDIHQFVRREDVKGASRSLVGQVKRSNRKRRLIGKVCSHENLSRAFKQVKRNKGVAGADEIPVGEFTGWFKTHGAELVSQILRGIYYPSPVRSVSIPKPNGGTRQLGIPTVGDRVIQQAIQQVLSPVYEVDFSYHSYGFRPNRSAYQA